MAFRSIPFFHEVFKNLTQLLLLNTIREHSDGITLYDLKKIGHLPHSKLYRIMKKLEEEQYLIITEEKNETGRPKFIYFISKKGIKYQNLLKSKLSAIFDDIKNTYNKYEDFDTKNFLDKTTFDMWKDPIGRCMEQDVSNEEKLKHLAHIEEETINHLNNLKKTKKKLEKLIQQEKRKGKELK